MINHPPQLTLYSRENCHLCEDMLDALEIYQEELGYCLTVYDIDDDEALVAKYNEHVPLVLLDEQEVMRYFFELATLKTALAEVN
jgi:glutaredoxin